ncbi:hypothetical protein AOQ84DRAFT_227836 [Glonium stellatum]|uniref:Uncharacterized protein n=1 Tax=Glonium stellatum TaxID=574774 RepID=A0A8E2F8N6_9PEZI|nr:hypothetical protein AOQ84DRAFT_227836 [Glonium stellatum]
MDRVAGLPHPLELVALDDIINVADGGADVVTPAIKDCDGDEVELTLVEKFADTLGVEDNGGVDVTATMEPVSDGTAKFAEDGEVKVGKIVETVPLPKTTVEFLKRDVTEPASVEPVPSGFVEFSDAVYVEADGAIEAEPLPNSIVEFADAAGPEVDDETSTEPVADSSVRLADSVGLEVESKIITEPVLLGIVEFADWVGREVEGNSDTEPLPTPVVKFEYGIEMDVEGNIGVSLGPSPPTRDPPLSLKVKPLELGAVRNAEVTFLELNEGVDNVPKKDARLVIPVPAVKVELGPRDVASGASQEVVPFDTITAPVEAIVEFDGEGKTPDPERVTVGTITPVLTIDVLLEIEDEPVVGIKPLESPWSLNVKPDVEIFALGANVMLEGVVPEEVIISAEPLVKL